jgi:hypothetical protein
MADEATLRDTAVHESAAIDAPAAVEAVAAPRILDAPDPEAAEIGRILLESGVTKDQINDLLQAPKALDALRSTLQGNPQEFFNMLQRTDAKTEENILQAAADRFVERYGDKAKPNGNGKPDANSDLMREVEGLREEIRTVRGRDEQRERNAANAATRQRYEARVDDLFNLEGVKQLGLTKSEQRAMRAQLDVELSKDPSIVQRASNGNFVDVPKAFKEIAEGWASDRKAATEEAKGQRDRTNKNAFAEFSPGANPFMNIEIPTGSADSWDATENAFAAALDRTR